MSMTFRQLLFSHKTVKQDVIAACQLLNLNSDSLSSFSVYDDVNAIIHEIKNHYQKTPSTPLKKICKDTFHSQNEVRDGIIMITLGTGKPLMNLTRMLMAARQDVEIVGYGLDAPKDFSAIDWGYGFTRWIAWNIGPVAKTMFLLQHSNDMVHGTINWPSDTHFTVRNANDLFFNKGLVKTEQYIVI